MARKDAKTVIANTADVRAKLLAVWRQLDDKEISLSEARVHIAAGRAVLDTLKVEIAMAHLQNSVLGPVSLTGKGIPLVHSLPERKQ